MTLTDLILLVLGYSILAAVISVMVISYSMARAHVNDRRDQRELNNSDHLDY